jgi:glutamate-ammonia-ligase adenylyltransferase
MQSEHPHPADRRDQLRLRFLDECVQAGSEFDRAELEQLLDFGLSGVPRQVEVLAHLLRFAEASYQRAALIRQFLGFPPSFGLAVTLFAQSDYLADVLVREPGLFHWLLEDGQLGGEVDRNFVDGECARIESMFPLPERQLAALKRLHRRLMLGIAARDVMGKAPLPIVGRELSDLADGMSEAVLRLSELQLRPRNSAPDGFRFSVIGLGKLGGEELNYSSDIDVMFLYSVPEGADDEPAHAFANLLAERFVGNLSGVTEEGMLYRVDTRLRPESGAGPLARSLRSYLIYYESRGELWERQMLIKARHVAGSRSVTDEFLGTLVPFVFPRTLLEHPLEAIARIKRKIELKIGDRANVKLRPGGIRDIEFVVQALQLMNGGGNPGLRTRNTLEALTLLTREGLLSAQEEQSLRESYVFLRTLEHRLQMAKYTQTHTVPDDDESLTTIAWRMGISGGAAELLKTQARHLNTVRSIFDHVMAGGRDDNGGGIGSVLDGMMWEEESRAVIRSYGITDMARAQNALRLLAGESLTGERKMDARARAAFRETAPAIFDGLRETPDPDFSLSNLALLLSGYPAPYELISGMRDQGYRRLLLQIVSRSSFLVKGFIGDPLAFEVLVSDIRALADVPSAGKSPEESLHDFKRRGTLRAALRFILGFSDVVRLTAELSSLADEVVKGLFATGGPDDSLPRNLAVFSVGKFGSREMSFSSDLDLVFVSVDADETSLHRQEEAAARLLRNLTAVTERGALYEADARLRPEGRNAPLVIGLRAYRDYLATRASLWERQALTRFRFVCGDEDVGASAVELVRRFVYERPLPEGWATEIVTMRRKMERQSRTGAELPIDLKRSRGGMIDIEFIAQGLHLKLGNHYPGEFFEGTFPVLQRMGIPVLREEERASMLEAYLYYRRAEAMLKLVLEEQGSALPSTPALDTLSRCIDGLGGDEFRQALRQRMGKTRIMFDQIFQRL